MHRTTRHLWIECRTFVQYCFSKLLLTICGKRHLDRVVKLRNEQPRLVPRVVTFGASSRCCRFRRPNGESWGLGQKVVEEMFMG